MPILEQSIKALWRLPSSCAFWYSWDEEYLGRVDDLSLSYRFIWS